jgi:hypothetical protein
MPSQLPLLRGSPALVTQVQTVLRVLNRTCNFDGQNRAISSLREKRVGKFQQEGFNPRGDLGKFCLHFELAVKVKSFRLEGIGPAQLDIRAGDRKIERGEREDSIV